MTGLLEAIFSFLKRGILANVYIEVGEKKHILPFGDKIGEKDR